MGGSFASSGPQPTPLAAALTKTLSVIAHCVPRWLHGAPRTPPKGEHGALRAQREAVLTGTQAQQLAVRVERSTDASAGADAPTPEEGRVAGCAAVRWHQYVDTLPDSTTLLVESDPPPQRRRSPPVEGSRFTVDGCPWYTELGVGLTTDYANRRSACARVLRRDARRAVPTHRQGALGMVP
jgi:hypothetical protein